MAQYLTTLMLCHEHDILEENVRMIKRCRLLNFAYVAVSHNTTAEVKLHILT